jgi:hypothetical protein
VNKMNTYTVRGEYGIQQQDCIEIEYQARTENSAKNKFIREVKKKYPHAWERIGESNIYVTEGKNA